MRISALYRMQAQGVYSGRIPAGTQLQPPFDAVAADVSHCYFSVPRFAPKYVTRGDLLVQLSRQYFRAVVRLRRFRLQQVDPDASKYIHISSRPEGLSSKLLFLFPPLDWCTLSMVGKA